VLAALPDNAFCSPVADAALDERTREEEVLARLTEVRAAGATSCGGAASARPSAALRLDARLTCAARVLAQDLAVTRALSVVDSEGRSTEDRLRAAGYRPSLWADGFALEARSAMEALDLMLSDSQACTQLTSASFADIGVGGAGDVLVVTLGAP
jgi:uncharacterized protein YkwD